MRLKQFTGMLDWVFRPYAVLDAHKHDDWFRIEIPGVPIWATQDPAAVKEIFTGDPSCFRAGYASRALKPTLGAHSLILLDDHEHLQQRRLLLPAFHGDAMHSWGPTMRKLADACVDDFPLNRTFKLHPFMQRVTLEIILRIIFGLRQDEVMNEVRRATEAILARASIPFATVISQWTMATSEGSLRYESLQRKLGRWSPFGWFLAQKERINVVLRKQIAHSRATGATTSMLDQFVQARDENGTPLSDEAILDELFTLLMAGHQTTATALSCALYRINRHQEVRTRLRQELDQIDSAKDPRAIWTAPYLDAVIKETLRLHVVTPFAGRYVTQPVRIAGRDFPSDIIVAPCMYLVHRREDLWPDPERFDPGRFLKEKQPSPYEWFPFGGGVRRCIGMAFGLYEVKMMVATFLARAELEIAPGYPGRMRRNVFTFTLDGGLPVRQARAPRPRVNA